MGVAYAQAVVAKRRQLWLGLLVLGVCVLFSGHITEISFSKFFDNIGAFTSYIVRIAHLENGQSDLSNSWRGFGGGKNGCPWSAGHW